MKTPSFTKEGQAGKVRAGHMGLSTTLEHWSQWWSCIEREERRIEKEREGFLKRETRRAERKSIAYYQKLFGFGAFWSRFEKQYIKRRIHV